MKTALLPESASLVFPMAFSFLAHGGTLIAVIVSSLVAERCGPAREIIDLDKTIEVSMVVLPHTDKKVPDRAQKAPVPAGAPEPAPPAIVPDKVSDLAIHTDKPDPKTKGQPDRQAERDKVLKQMERDKLLDDFDAPDGPTDRQATDPNSTSDEAIRGLNSEAKGDPEYRKYIAKLEALFGKDFKPLETIVRANPDLLCVVQFVVSDDGTVTGYEIVQGSNNPSFDAAAESAAALVRKIPLPPEKYLPLMSQGYTYKYRAPRTGP
jgi:TonB family protein